MTKKEYLEMAKREVNDFVLNLGRYSTLDPSTVESVFRGRIALLKECVDHERMKDDTKRLINKRISSLAGAALME